MGLDMDITTKHEDIQLSKTLASPLALFFMRKNPKLKSVYEVEEFLLTEKEFNELADFVREEADFSESTSLASYLKYSALSTIYRVLASLEKGEKVHIHFW